MGIPCFLQFLQEKSSANKGDVFEFVFAAACIARLCAIKSQEKKVSPITANLVLKIMDDFFEREKTVWSSKDKKFEVRLSQVNIPSEALEALRSKDYREGDSVKPMISGAISAVNSSNSSILALVHKIKRLKAKRIVSEVRAIGTSDQLGTKSDIDIVLQGDEENKIRISAKYTSGQLGQYSGKNISQQIVSALGDVGLKPSKDLIEDLKQLEASNQLKREYSDRNDPNKARDQELLSPFVNNIFRKFSNTPVNVDKFISGFKKAFQKSEENLEVVFADETGSSYTLNQQLAEKLRSVMSARKVMWNFEESGNPTLWLVINLEAKDKAKLQTKHEQIKLTKIRFRYDVGNAPGGRKNLRTRTLFEVRSYQDLILVANLDDATNEI